MQQEIIDISVPVSEETVVWPEDPPFRTTEIVSFDEADVRVSICTMSLHTGTHVDAPSHFLRDGVSIDRLPLDSVMGPCVVLDVSGAGVRITASDLAPFDIRPGERVLLRTANSTRNLHADPEFANDFSHLSADGAAHLASRRVRCVGIDYLSIGGQADNEETHRILMDSGAWIIEGLDLRAVDPGEYELICLPLRLVGVEGAPARAVLRRMDRAGRDFADDALEWASLTG